MGHSVHATCPLGLLFPNGQDVQFALLPFENLPALHGEQVVAALSTPLVLEPALQIMH